VEMFKFPGKILQIPEPDCTNLVFLGAIRKLNNLGAISCLQYQSASNVSISVSDLPKLSRIGRIRSPDQEGASD
jgi:hypothetical protein